MDRYLDKSRIYNHTKLGSTMRKQRSSLSAKTNRKDPGSWGEHRWHSENVQVFPLKRDDFKNVQKIVDEFVLPGHLPASPMLTQQDTIVTIGSCFADDLRKALIQRKYQADIFWVPSGLNNTFALLDFVSWCISGAQTEQAYRYDRDSSGEINEWMPEEEQESYADHIKKAGAIVFTIGLAEVWEDQEAGTVFWRGVPDRFFDEDKHVFRLSTVDENQRNIDKLIEYIRRVNPHAPIVLTLSPVPLKATFRPISCMTADCVSKSVLRVALDQVMQAGHPDVYYWPSFEIVKWLGCHIPVQAYGYEDGHSRHVSRFLVDGIITSFLSRFFQPTLPAMESEAKAGRPQ